MRLRGIVVATLGVLSLVAAVVVRFVVVPGLSRLPADVDERRVYVGTLNLLLDQQAFESGNLDEMFRRDLPVEIRRHVTVEDTEGDIALVKQDVTVVIGEDEVLQDITEWHAVDRRTMAAVPSFPGADVPEREGLALGWPIGTEPRDYLGWSSDKQESGFSTFTGEEEHLGLHTYVFESESEHERVRDPRILEMFPSSVPKAMVTDLAGAVGELPPGLEGQLTTLIDQLPDPIPLAFLYSGTSKLWVEPITGAVIDLERTEIRTVAIEVGGVPIPVLPVFDWTYHTSEASIEEGVADARDGIAQLRLWGTYLPAGLSVAGVGLLILAWLLRRRRAGRPQAA